LGQSLTNGLRPVDDFSLHMVPSPFQFDRFGRYRHDAHHLWFSLFYRNSLISSQSYRFRKPVCDRVAFCGKFHSKLSYWNVIPRIAELPYNHKTAQEWWQKDIISQNLRTIIQSAIVSE
jgi:hypothetical protein